MLVSHRWTAPYIDCIRTTDLKVSLWGYMVIQTQVLGQVAELGWKLGSWRIFLRLDQTNVRLLVESKGLGQGRIRPLVKFLSSTVDIYIDLCLFLSYLLEFLNLNEFSFSFNVQKSTWAEAFLALNSVRLISLSNPSLAIAYDQRREGVIREVIAAFLKLKRGLL